MELRTDHVTVAGRDLDTLAAAFSDADFPAEYGGAHSNGATHMSVVGFRDGSYVELVSTLEAGAASPWWEEPIRGDGGPCAWAARVDDAAAAADSLRDRGVSVDGPDEYERERPDGTLVEWELAFPGGDRRNPGRTLPFLIGDRTPRERRVRPTGDLADSPLTGVEAVVLAVRDLDAAVAEFVRAFGLPTPHHGRLPAFNADVAAFDDAPVVLVAPRGAGWLVDRLDRFGPRPAAYLLGVEADVWPRFAATARDAAGTDGDDPVGVIADHDVAWVPPSDPVGRRYLGVVPV